VEAYNKAKYCQTWSSEVPLAAADSSTRVEEVQTQFKDTKTTL
jgi:hypothetical protein